LKPLALLAALFLAACSTAGTPQNQHQQVKVPMAVSCIPKDAPAAPKVHSDAELRAMDGPSRYVAVASDRLSLLAYALTAGPAIEACR
jgi:hypothetical protein